MDAEGKASVASTVLFEAALAARPFDATMSRWTMLEASKLPACPAGKASRGATSHERR